ncbi:hypothetical protein [Streptomyces sp. NPDC029721]|uniref:hypothetical protein n=1 Tax=unclassified Streptomyces TaxID=2593676 RepID=UPI0033EEB65D
MHQTRTSTKLLLGAACAVSAVSAVSGCVNVSPAPMRPAGSPSDAGAPRHEPRGGPGALPVVVQAPALEALKAVPRDGAARPSAPTAAGRGTARTAPGGTAQALEAEEAAGAVPDIPEPRRHAEHAQRLPGGLPGPLRPDARVPRELARELPVRPADVCALGRRHGNWQPDSPEARICAGVHEG